MNKLKVYLCVDGIEQTHHFNFITLDKDTLIANIKDCAQYGRVLVVADVDGKILYINFPEIKACNVLIEYE